jgi:MSHA biogenesis protein MshE
MGAAGFLVGSSLRAVIAQRLVRKICEYCLEDHSPDSQEMMWLTHLAGDEAITASYKKGRGCQSCQYTGYRGRIGVFELLEMNDAMMAALKRDDAEAFTELAKANPTFTPLAQAAFNYAKQGIISAEEVLRLVDSIDVQG